LLFAHALFFFFITFVFAAVLANKDVYTGWPKKVSHYQIIKKSY